MKDVTVAILGSTAHVARGLICRFVRQDRYNLHLFTRSPERLKAFLEGIHAREPVAIVSDYGLFRENHYDVVINCIGVGTAAKLRGDYSLYFSVLESYDALVTDYLLHGHTETLYISLSSGAVYGRRFPSPAHADTVNAIAVNHVEPQDYYGIVRLYLETKHRSLTSCNIVDLRLFSYFSRFADLSDGYLLTDIIQAVLQKETLVTASYDIHRDYVHPKDLYQLACRCMDRRSLNGAMDVCSLRPVRKMEVLEFFAERYGLAYRLDSGYEPPSATGTKMHYYSTWRNNDLMEFHPRYTSMETIAEESEALMRMHGANRCSC